MSVNVVAPSLHARMRELAAEHGGRGHEPGEVSPSGLPWLCEVNDTGERPYGLAHSSWSCPRCAIARHAEAQRKPTAVMTFHWPDGTTEKIAAATAANRMIARYGYDGLLSEVAAPPGGQP